MEFLLLAEDDLQTVLQLDFKQFIYLMYLNNYMNKIYIFTDSNEWTKLSQSIEDKIQDYLFYATISLKLFPWNKSLYLFKYIAYNVNFSFPINFRT